MTFPFSGTQAPDTQYSRRSLFWLRAFIIAAIAAFAAGGPAAGEAASIPSGTISVLTWNFTAVEGQSFTGVIAAFTDTDSVTASNFTLFLINWGDGTITSAAMAEQSGVDSHLFFISGTHTYAEEGSFPIVLTFHDTNDGSNPLLTSSTAAVDDATLCVCRAVAPGSPTTFPGTGGNASSGGARNAQSAFEAAIGGANNGSTPVPQPGGFRTLTWDAVKLDGTDFGGNTSVIDLNKTVGIPVDRFQERGALFSRVTAVSGDGFADVNAGVTSLFTAFTPANDFAPFNAHEVDLNFVLPSLHTTSARTAGTRGFGGIFINVLNPTQSSIEYFAGPISLGRFYVTQGLSTPPSYSFLGVIFSQPIVTRVHLTLGSGTIFRFDGSTFAAGVNDDVPEGANVVALDDLAYAEPQPVTPAPRLIITPTINTAFTSRVGTFIDTDPNANAADFTALIDWGDGHTSPGRIVAAGGGGFNVNGSNTYVAGGAFPITFTVEDFGGSNVIGSAEAVVPPPLFLPLVTH